MPPRPNASPLSLSAPPLLSLTQPFTPSTLNSLRNHLGYLSQSNSQTTDTHLGTRGNAAVLIPFCNVHGIPGILLEVRGKALRTHSGEVSFPGGKVDHADASYMDAALRETHEELGIHPSRVDVLGEIGPTEINLRGDLRVWPFVGFVRSANDERNTADFDALPSIDLSALKRGASQPEVATVFHLPLAALAAPLRLRPYLFRGQRPYWAVDVADLVRNVEGDKVGIHAVATEMDADLMYSSTRSEPQDEVGSGKEGRLEVWGLTGWYLSLLMRTLNVYR